MFYIADLLKSENKIVYFKNNSYPVLFFSLLFKQIKINNNIKFNYINVQDVDLEDLKSKLEVSFLGSKLFFWLGNISSLTEKKEKELVKYLNLYKGQHIIWFFSEKSLPVKEIDCSHISNIEQCENILDLFNIKSKKAILNFLQKILIKFNHKLPLDDLCMLIQYAVVIGSKIDYFMDSWFDKIFIPEQSLFILSKNFFSKDKVSFFNSLSLCQDYSPVFWTSFWSEQLFRAYNFIDFKNKNREIEAKQISYRLPFNFINYDWKKVSLNELKNAHQYIYLTDYNLKKWVF